CVAYTELGPRVVGPDSQPICVNSWRIWLGECARHPSSFSALNARYQSNGPRAPPCSASTFQRPKEPPEAPIEVPGKSRPVLVRTASAPPSVFNPKIGLDPGMTSIPEIASRGMRSQLTVSPNPSLNRMPSRYTDSPMALPARGEARKPRWGT